MNRNYRVVMLLFTFLSHAAFSQQKQQDKSQTVKEVITNSGEKNIPRNIQQEQLKQKPENLIPETLTNPLAGKKKCCSKCKRKTGVKRTGK